MGSFVIQVVLFLEPHLHTKEVIRKNYWIMCNSDPNLKQVWHKFHASLIFKNMLKRSKTSANLFQAWCKSVASLSQFGTSLVYGNGKISFSHISKNTSKTDMRHISEY